jgi:glutathione S-transferase
MMMESTKVEEAVEWTVCYHAKENGDIVKGRADFLRLILEDAGTSYLNSAADLYGPNGMMDSFRGSVDAVAVSAPDKKIHFPVFFPPAIWHRPKDGDEVLINQVGACLIYLGDKLGYAPVSDAERARANCIMLNALDFISEGRNSFHPVKNSMSYKEQKEEGDKASKEFSQHRMLIFLHHFDKVVKINGTPAKPIAGGENVTYADFCLFHVLHATSEQFNTEFYDKSWDRASVPQLKQYYEWMKSRPNIHSYLQSDRCARKYLCYCRERFCMICRKSRIVISHLLLNRVL